MLQMRVEGDSDQDGRDGSRARWSYRRSVLKGEQIGVIGALDAGRWESQTTPSF